MEISTKRLFKTHRSKRLRHKIRCQRGTHNIKMNNKRSLMRVVVHKTNRHLTVQGINDVTHDTLFTISTHHQVFKENVNDSIKSYNSEGARKIGELVSNKMKEVNITAYVFDRRGYHINSKNRKLTQGRISYLIKSMDKHMEI